MLTQVWRSKVWSRPVRTFATNVKLQPNKDEIVNIRKTMHAPSKPLEFGPDGRCLLYYHEPSFLTKVLLYAKTVIPFALVFKLIRLNPFYNTMPVALPFMFILEVVLMKRIWKQKLRLRNMVNEIWLHKNGEDVEIVYMNKFFRKLRKDSVSQIFLIPSFQFTDDPNDLEYKVLTGEHFPRALPIKSESWNWAWIRYYHNNTESFYIPKQRKYMNEEILVAVLNGKLIDTSPKHVVSLPSSKLEQIKKPSN